MRHSLIEAATSSDVLLLARIDKPALLRRLLELGCRYSGQVLSFTEMLGHLQERGDTTTIAHYLDLLGAAGLWVGLQRLGGQAFRRRASSPKLQVLNTALVTAQAGLSSEATRGDPAARRRLNAAAGGGVALFYWRDLGRDVVFVLRRGRRLVTIEVKSGRPRDAFPGTGAFEHAFGPHRKLLVGTGGIPPEDFLAHPATHWLGD